MIVRSEEKGEPWLAKGAKIAITDLQDAEKLSGYLARAEGAYLLIPPNYGNPDFLAGQRKVAEALAKAVSDSMIPHVVFLSSIGAQLNSGTGLILVNHYGETELKPVAQEFDFTAARILYGKLGVSSYAPSKKKAYCLLSSSRNKKYQ